MPPLRKSKWCYSHHPRKAQERSVARKRGGQNRKRTNGDDPPENVNLATAHDIQTLLERVARDAFLLDNSTRRARALIALAQVALRGLEIGELEQRIEALENYCRSAGSDVNK